MVQGEGLNDAITNWVVSDWFIVDGKWRHLSKRYIDGEIMYYCDGKLVKTTTENGPNSEKEESSDT